MQKCFKSLVAIDGEFHVSNLTAGQQGDMLMFTAKLSQGLEHAS